jgi:phage/plasmid-like protein (TIGR03299 family)
MPHNLHFEREKAAMMYTGKPPWHGLGTRLSNPATSAQAIQAAGLGWDVQLVPLQATDEHGSAWVTQRMAVVRSDLWGQPDCPVFGVVSPDYQPLQNRDAFAFFDSVVGEGAAIYHTAGALGRGERIWVLAKLPGEFTVGRDDLLHRYLLLSTGHDGQTAVQLKFTPIRVVCQNTLTFALRMGGAIVIAHDHDLRRGLEDAKRTLQLVPRRYASLEQGFAAMASVDLDVHRMRRYLTAVFPEPEAPASPQDAQRVRHDRQECERRFDQGPAQQLAGVKGTLWAAYNAVTEYADHGRSAYSGEQRLRSIWFGRAEQIKSRAHREAINMLRRPHEHDSPRPACATRRAAAVDCLAGR